MCASEWFMQNQMWRQTQEALCLLEQPPAVKRVDGPGENPSAEHGAAAFQLTYNCADHSHVY